MTFEDGLRLLMPEGALGDQVQAVILACAKAGLIRIEEDGRLVLTEKGRGVAEEASTEGP